MSFRFTLRLVKWKSRREFWDMEGPGYKLQFDLGVLGNLVRWAEFSGKSSMGRAGLARWFFDAWSEAAGKAPDLGNCWPPGSITLWVDSARNMAKSREDSKILDDIRGLCSRGVARDYLVFTTLD